MVRFQIVLDPAEADSLARWAASELRDPRDQLRMILRSELERRGLLPPTERHNQLDITEPASPEAKSA